MSTSTSTYAAESNGDDHSVALTNYIFNVGYMGQNWADVQLTFFNDALKLHRSESESCRLITWWHEGLWELEAIPVIG